MIMILDTIDFISAYCDRWCERCAFTSRCSAYAVRAAIAMCDNDFERALKLTFGPAPDGPPRRHSRLIEQFANYMPTEKELAGFTREKEESEERIDESRLKTTSEMASLLSSQWLTDRRERTGACRSGTRRGD